MLKKVLLVLFVLLLIAAGIGYWGYNSIFSPNTNFTEDKAILKIPGKSSFDDVLSIMKEENILSDLGSFERVAGWMKYTKSEVPSGKYEVIKGSNNREIVGLLRSGSQKPVEVIFNNVRTLSDLAGALSKNMAVDSVSMDKYLNDSETQKTRGFNKDNFMTAFIPNTYSMFWDKSEQEIVDRLIKEKESFWMKNDRLEKAETLQMTPQEVYILASIVEKESQYGPERPIIAGLYLNRLKRGIALQADPTVVYATGDFGLRRVLNKHLKIDSPYNTYKNTGLPPGPIYMPSIESIDAVLNYKKHDYLYMCAKPGFGTKHAFAKTLRGHNENANRYRRWLNTQGIK